MSSVRVRFMMTVVGSNTDNKTNVWALRTMQFLDIDDDTIYEFPPQYTDLAHHDKLFALPAAITACKRMPNRHSKRHFRVTLPDAVARIYVDEDGNPIFHGDPLDIFADISETASSMDTAASSSRSITAAVKEAVLAATSAAVSDAPRRSISSITKDAVMSKFNPKQHNASSWITIFERECVRLKIGEERYWEVIRLFLEGAAESWFSSVRHTTPNTSWEFWRASFLKNFSKTSWNTAAAAFNYHYIAGSYTDYVHTKISMLTSYNPNMHVLDLMSHVVLGLPINLQDRINPNEVSKVDDLVSTIIQFEKPFVRKTSDQKSYASSPSLSSASSAFSSLRPRTPCPYCKSKGFERYHKEADCFTKFKDQRDKANSSRSSNNIKSAAIHSFDMSSLQEAISSESKNE